MKPWTKDDGRRLSALSRQLLAEMGEPDFRTMAYGIERRAGQLPVEHPPVLVIGIPGVPAEHLLRVAKIDRTWWSVFKDVRDERALFLHTKFIGFIWGQDSHRFDRRRLEAVRLMNDLVKKGRGQWLEDWIGARDHPLRAFIAEARR